MSTHTIPTTTHTTIERTTAPAAHRRTGRAANIALWVLQVLTAGVFVMAAVPKLIADPQAVAGFTMMGLGVTGMYAVGVLEVLGAVALLIPVLSGLAATCLVALMIGAVTVTVMFVGAGSVLVVPGAVLAVVSVLAWARRRRTVELVRLVRRYVR
jgi:uncharacterized membrane protein YphA (DoxX/SURF4 family)